MACDRRLTTLRYGRDHYVSRLPRHTPRLSSLASVAHPSLHPLVPEARRRRGEGTRGGGRKGRRDGPLHITYSPVPYASPRLVRLSLRSCLPRLAFGSRNGVTGDGKRRERHGSGMRSGEAKSE